MGKKVFITGYGIISGLGLGIDETLISLKNRKSGIGTIKYLPTIHTDLPVSEVKFTNEELKSILHIPGKTGYTRTALLGMLAAKEAYESAGPNLTQALTGIITGTTVGGMDMTEKYYKDFLTAGEKRIYITTHDCGDSTEKIADYLNISDYVNTISTACSSSANSIIHAVNMIKSGMLDRAIAGGTDSLTKFTLNGFNSLMILDKELCKPFDEHRNGLNLGEGAGFIVLESEELVGKENKIPLCELSGFGNANDAYHQTASSPTGEGAFLAMSKALESAGLKPEDISYINAHGTATEYNDISEGRAIERLFRDKLPPISSTKPYTGHTLGASGGIEAVISILAIKEGLVFPNLNFSEKISGLNFSPVSEIIQTDIRHVLSNSFGFGGNNSSLLFSKCSI